MLCERCGKKDATIHLTETMQKKRSEVHLCEVCAGKIGLNSKLSNFSISIPDTFSFSEMDDQAADEIPLCGVCGTDFVIYAKHGKLGCPDCYRYLENPISGIIKSYHGDKKHSGKIPPNFEEAEVMPERFLDENVSDVKELKENLLAAIQEERYEDAAVLRDRINLAVKNGVEHN